MQFDRNIAHLFQWICLQKIISLICDNSVTTQNLWFFRRNFQMFEVLWFSMSATTTRLLSSGEFCKLRYDTIPVKSASANVSFYTSKSKMPNFNLWHSCRKWAIWNWNVRSEHGTDFLQKMDYSSLLHIIKDRQTALVQNLPYYDTV
jgi:hypothetical protein